VASLNRVTALLDSGRVDDAGERLLNLLSTHPSVPELHYRLGQTRFRQRRIVDALAEFSLAAQYGLDPDEAAGERWMGHMLLGDFESAWRETDNIEHGPASGKGGRGLLWNGSDFGDKRVLVECRHGLGDTLQFARYGPLLKRVCRSAVLRCQPNLVSLLARCDLFDRVVPAGGPVPDHDVAIESMELPYAFRTTVGSVPCDVPYVAAGRASELDGSGMRAGLVWASGPYDTSRSIPLAKFAVLEQVRPLTWIPLQHGPEYGQLRRDGPRLGITKIKAPADDEALTTARQIARLDLVLSVDTMVAHLAAAMGKPVWLLLPFEADWRWMLRREDSPWYPSMRIFRQSRPGDWDDPLRRVAGELQQWAEGPQPRGRGNGRRGTCPGSAARQSYATGSLRL
jgi:hypothetical protein